MLEKEKWDIRKWKGRVANVRNRNSTYDKARKRKGGEGRKGEKEVVERVKEDKHMRLNAGKLGIGNDG